MSQQTINRLEGVGEFIGDASVFMVTGGDSFIACGAEAILNDVLDPRQVFRFSDFTPNPKLEDIKHGIDAYRQSDANFIMAVGGGSPIDVAKSIHILTSQNSDDYEGMVMGASANDPLKGTFLAAPTTAGTGSEATQFAVVYINGEKYSLSHPEAVAEVAVLDPRLTASMSPYVTASTGMDAIAQATEAHWSVNSTEVSRSFSQDALRLLLPAIVTAVQEQTELSRESMLRGANWAGQAINIAKTTAAHAVSYPITSKFGVAHGHAVGLTLPSFAEFNGDVNELNIQDKRGIKFTSDRMEMLYSIYGVRNGQELREYLENLMDKIGLERNLGRLGIDGHGVDTIISNVNAQRMANNPRTVHAAGLRRILSSL